VLTSSVYLDALTRDAATFIELVDSADHELPVPFCPGWNVGDLARHLGGIHRWAHDAVVTGAPGEEPEGPTDRNELSSWLTQGVAQLHEVLSSADPQTPTWTFGPKPRLVEFWIRRQAQETFVHLWDAQAASGISLRNDDELALDGIDEVVNVFFPRQVRLGRTVPLEQGVDLHVSDFPGRECVLAGDGGPADVVPVGTITGTAAELLRLVWGRIDIGDLHVMGSADACDQLVAANLTP